MRFRIAPPTAVLIVGLLTDIAALVAGLAGLLPQKWANIAIAIGSVLAGAAKIVSYLSEQKAAAKAAAAGPPAVKVTGSTPASAAATTSAGTATVVSYPHHRKLALGTMLGLVGIVVASLVIAGVSTTHHSVKRISAEPVLPGGVAPPPQSVPPCTPAATKGFMGRCAPERTTPQLVAPPAPGSRTGTVQSGSTTTTISTRGAVTQLTGPDTSNWDPVYAPHWAAVVRYHPFGEEKATQGFWRDPTWSAQSRDARAAGSITGGYDFATVCQDAASSDAKFYVSVVKSTVGFGARTMPPTLDAEFGSGSVSCARAWIGDWIRTVVSLTHRTPLIYTGAWWWNPHVGCWWPGGYAWISGYGVTYPYMPCGRSQLDMWQYSDSSFNGWIRSDMSVIRQNYAGITNSGGASSSTRKLTPAQRKARERRLVRRLYGTRRRARASLLAHHCRVARPSRTCRAELHAGDVLGVRIRALHARGVF